MVRCPTEVELERFLADALDGDSQAVVGRHLESCPRCRGWIDEATGDEALLDELRHSAKELFETPPVLARYRALRILGRGAMGVVWEAEQERPRRRVALKVLPADALTPARRTRFEHEAELLGRLDHPNVAKVHEAGTFGPPEDERPYIAMVLVDGRPADVYASSERIGQRARVELVAAICDGVQHAHQHGVLHRDLKPSNVLVDGTGRPRVLDFGVARALDAAEQSLRTAHGQFVGTLAYASPEQVSGDPARVDARSDVWALGVLLFELLAGQRPHSLDELSLAEAARRIAEEPPARLGNVAPGIPRDLDWIAARALELDPARRYPSAAALAADLRRHLAHEPVEARPPSALYLASRFARRNRALVGGVLATVLTLAFGLMTTREQLARAELAERAATRAAVRWESVADLFQVLLLQASPLQRSQEEPLTLIQAVEIANERLERHTPEDPVAEALFRHTVARVWNDLGRFEAADAQLQRALEIWDEHGGDQDDSDLAYTLRTAGAFALNRGRAGDAESLTRRSIEMYERLGWSDLASKATCLSNLGLALAIQGENEEGLAHFKEAEELYAATLGAACADVGVTLKNQALVLRRLDRRDEAIAALDEAIEILTVALGEGHPYTTQAEGQRLVIRLDRGDRAGVVEEALALLERTEARLDDREHPKLFSPLDFYGRALIAADRHAESIPVFRRALAIQTLHNGLDDPRAARTRQRLAGALRAVGETDEAERLESGRAPATNSEGEAGVESGGKNGDD